MLTEFFYASYLSSSISENFQYLVILVRLMLNTRRATRARPSKRSPSIASPADSERRKEKASAEQQEGRRFRRLRRRRRHRTGQQLAVRVEDEPASVRQSAICEGDRQAPEEVCRRIATNSYWR